ncbi:shikimate kinase [Actinomarinicola tropica]|nr:shikimate kinase [Actinomarinicola tropica]
MTGGQPHTADQLPTIVLVGLMGTGKSTIGRALADRLGRDFLDSDRMIEARTGQTVRELWEAGGEAAYRPLERAVVVAALGAEDPVVLAAPGGVVEDGEAVRALQRGAAVVYLRTQPETIAARLGGEVTHRPLLDGEPEELLSTLFARRDAMYRDIAGVVVEADGLPPDAVVEAVLDALATGGS